MNKQLGKGFGATGCPCLLANPCRSSCSCAFPVLSGGCARCALYGNDDQRAQSSTILAKQAIYAELGKKLQHLINGGMDSRGNKFSVANCQQLVRETENSLSYVTVFCRRPLNK